MALVSQVSFRANERPIVRREILQLTVTVIMKQNKQKNSGGWLDKRTNGTQRQRWRRADVDEGANAEKLVRATTEKNFDLRYWIHLYFSIALPSLNLGSPSLKNQKGSPRVSRRRTGRRRGRGREKETT